MPDQKAPLSYQDIIREEYKKCFASPVYFMKNYVKIQHPIRGTIFFDLFPFQEQTLQDLHDYNFNIILKSRQMGISTLVAAYSLWLMIFHKDKNILIISLKQDVAKEIITKVRFANDNLPTWLKIKCEEDNRLSLKFANGSQIRATSTTKKSGVSLALSLLIIDEAGLIDEAEELWTSAQPTLSTGGRSIILSTPRGVGNWFHKMWVGSEENNDGRIGKNGFHPIKLPWDLHPERDSEWRRIEGDKQGNPKKAAQEFDCDFIATGDNVIDLSIIEWYKKSKKQEPVDIRGVDRGLWVWQFPDYTHSYIVCADVARGDGADFSAAHVIDISLPTPTQVAEYKGNLGTKDFGNFLVGLSTEYNNALLIVERENVGWSTLQACIDREYKNLFYSSSDLKYVDVQRQLSNNYYSEEKKLVPGFSTNIKTRPLVIAHLEQFFRDKSIDIFSTRTLAELETFIWKNGKAQAMDGYNDDLTMALGIGLWVRDTALRLRQEGVELTRVAVDQMNRNKIDQTPVYKSNQAQVGKKAWQMTTGRTGFGSQTTEDIRWLLG
jgi:hypothetical protein